MAIGKLEPILEDIQLVTSLKPFFEYDTGTSYILAVHGNDALPLWYRLRFVAAESGLWPVILGSEDIFASHRGRLEKARQRSASGKIEVTATIEETLRQSPEACFRQRSSSLMYWNREEEPAVYIAESSEPESPEPAWQLITDPSLLEDNVFSAPTIANDPLDHHPAPSVVIALFPTTSAWHIPAYVQIDAFNDAPDLAGHLCVWRWWQRLHQAEIVNVLLDAIEAWIAKTPIDPAALERLDWEQHVYAPDLGEVRAGELDSVWVWRFWWD